MSYTALQADGQISRVHTMALSKEIGERLRFGLASERTVTPPHLLKLMTQFQLAEYPGNSDHRADAN
jgi:hypothetical protein